MKRRHFRRKRRGTILVLAAVLMVMVMAMLAFAVDLGYLQVARGKCNALQILLRSPPHGI